MRRASDLCDYFFICSANSTRQAKAIADAAIEELKKKKGITAWHIEGYKEGQWILLDYNVAVIHIFCGELRSFYRLERLWGDAPLVDFSKLRESHAKIAHRRKSRLSHSKRPKRT